jgi:hypothetical protein
MSPSGVELGLARVSNKDLYVFSKILWCTKRFLMLEHWNIQEVRYSSLLRLCMYPLCAHLGYIVVITEYLRCC